MSTVSADGELSGLPVLSKQQKRQRQLFTVASFNLRGISSNVQRETLRRDLKVYKVDVCTLQETKVTEAFDQQMSGYRLLCFAPSCRHYGLGFAVSSEWSSSIHRFWALSDRVAVLTLRLKHNSSSLLAIINAYVPTCTKCSKDASDLDKFLFHSGKGLFGSKVVEPRLLAWGFQYQGGNMEIW